jgi:tRNA U38,U39,U40 pseudouridine synthase TruA
MASGAQLSAHHAGSFRHLQHRRCQPADMALASQQTAASFLFSMVRIMRPIRKGRDLPLPTTRIF